MANKVCQNFSKMPNSAQAEQDFTWLIKMNTAGSPQLIHLVSKQTKFHLILSEKLVVIGFSKSGPKGAASKSTSMSNNRGVHALIHTYIPKVQQQL